jgi:hypothetical protein
MTKTLTTMTAIAALVAGISVASAQNAATPNNTTNPPPGSINAGDRTGTSGSETTGAATNSSGKSAKMVTGKSKFCITAAAGSNNLDCKFARIAACEKEAKLEHKTCQPNPNLNATTGMKSKQ